MGRCTGYALLFAVVLTLIGAGAPAADAAPIRKLDGHPLTGSEKVVAKAIDERFAIPGVTTECAHATMVLGIAGEGIGGGTTEVEEFLGEGCTAASKCDVEAFKAKKLPWPAHVTVVGGKEYLVLEDMHIEILYGGPECALAGTVIVKGSAAGLYERSTETITFNKASESAGGTSLKVGSSAVEWDALFAVV